MCYDMEPAKGSNKHYSFTIAFAANRTRLRGLWATFLTKLVPVNSSMSLTGTGGYELLVYLYSMSVVRVSVVDVGGPSFYQSAL